MSYKLCMATSIKLCGRRLFRRYVYAISSIQINRMVGIRLQRTNLSSISRTITCLIAIEWPRSSPKIPGASTSRTSLLRGYVVEKDSKYRVFSSLFEKVLFSAKDEKLTTKAGKVLNMEKIQNVSLGLHKNASLILHELAALGGKSTQKVLLNKTNMTKSTLSRHILDLVEKKILVSKKFFQSKKLKFADGFYL